MAQDPLPLGRRPQGRTLITASWVVGHRDGGHRLLKNGEVVFEDGEILFVGPLFRPAASTSAMRWSAPA